eukprot:76707_1
MSEIALQLYRSLQRKALLATKGQQHLFRFQREPSVEMWGKGFMYEMKKDRELLHTIFPKSIHEFIDNKYPFGPDLHGDGDASLHSEFYPDYIQDPKFNHGFNPITNEEKLKENITRDSTPTSSAVYSKNKQENEHIINEYDHYRLRHTMHQIFDKYRNETDMNRIHELVNDGFNVCRDLDAQIDINSRTSISQAQGIRIIATSKYVASIASHDPSKPHAFVYSLRIENHSHTWCQLLGRHWVIVDENNNQEILERFQPGVVGLQPQFNPGDIFVYGSGTFLPTTVGKMYGAFQFAQMNGELFEVPISTFQLHK